ncbi:MAG: S1 family peptidase [Myxococcota bacterium]|nr:S1 family peptidase [Myxococcota bacterium]
MKTMFSRLACTSLLAMLVACGAEESVTENNVEMTNSEISGGQNDSTSRNVVGVATFGGGGFGICSGSLISPNVVLTAFHCIAPLTNSFGGSVDCNNTGFGNPYNASSISITTDQTISQGSQYYGVSEIIIPPGSGVCGRDVALLVLSQPVPSADTEPLVPRVDSPIGVNNNGSDEVYSAVGYGNTSGAGGGSGQRRRRDGLITQCIGGSCPWYSSAFESEWMGETGVCQGDSGGPALDEVGRVIGVVSRGGQNCSTPIYARVDAWAEWMSLAVVEAAQDAGIQAPEWATGGSTAPTYLWPVGSSCEGGSDCPSGLCEDGICTRQCNEEFSCPAGFSCIGGGNGEDGVCRLQPVGTLCTEDGDDCLGGICANGLCTRLCLESPVPCPFGFTCNEELNLCRPIEIGTECQSALECDAGLCIDGLCTRACDLDLPCPNDWTCWNTMCVPSPVGVPCADDTPCLGGYCNDDYRCTTGCQTDGPCRGWTCQDFVCAP